MQRSYKIRWNGRTEDLAFCRGNEVKDAEIDFQRVDTFGRAEQSN